MNPTDNQTVRVKLIATKDGDKQQKVEAEGREGEQLGGGKHGMHRAQGYPLSSHLPAGSIGLVLMMGGNPDQSVMIGGEHPEHRPTGLAEGEWKLHDIWGKSLHATENGWVLQVGPLTIQATQLIIECDDINLGGLGGKRVAVEGTMDSRGDTLVSGFAATVKAI